MYPHLKTSDQVHRTKSRCSAPKRSTMYQRFDAPDLSLTTYLLARDGREVQR